MKIGIDISRTIEEATGVGYYAKHLVGGLSRVDPDNDYLLYGIFYECYPEKWKRAVIPKTGNFRLHQKGFPSWWVKRKWMNSGWPIDGLLGRVDIVHSTAFTMPPTSKVRTIVTIHDLSVLTYPQYHTEANCQFVTRNLHYAARRADFIIAVSESTKREIMRFLHVPDERIGVAYEAAGETFFAEAPPASIERIKGAYRITGPYFLAVGSIEPRKNLARALVAFKALVETERTDCQFVVAGGRGWKNEAFHRSIEKLGLGDRLVFTGYVPEEDLPPLYQGAEAFVYPSLYEGFGLPVLEAMASGVPVVTSNNSSLPEVAGDSALLVNPMEVFEIYEAMEALATKPNLRKELKNKGLERSRTFTWEKTARMTLDLYRRVFDLKKDS